MPKSKLNYWDISNRVWYVNKTRQDNDMINPIGVVYTKNETELSWRIRPSETCEKIRQDNNVTHHIGIAY